MAITFFWRCEGTTLDGTHDYSVGDTAATLNGGAVINTDAVRIGTNGLDVPTGSDYALFDVASHDLVTPSVGSFGFSIYVTTWVDGALLVNLQGTTGNDHIRLEMTGSDDLLLRHRLAGTSNLTIATSGNQLTTGAWFGVVCRWDDAANDRRIEIYNSSGTLVDSAEDLSTNFDVPTDIVACWFGEGAGANVDLYMDNIFLSQVYAEPLEDNLDITSYTNYGGGGTSASFNGLSLLGVS